MNRMEVDLEGEATAAGGATKVRLRNMGQRYENPCRLSLESTSGMGGAFSSPEFLAGGRV